MMQEQSESRLLVIADAPRLSEAVREHFAPIPVACAATYLEGIAEIPRAGTQAILVGVEPQCRKLERAIAAIRSVAGDRRIIFCCEPAYESWGRRAVTAGADDYLIFPPGVGELERALQIPARQTRVRWVQTGAGDVTPVAAEILVLSEIIANLDDRMPRLLDRMASLVQAGLGARWSCVVVDGSIGSATSEQQRGGVDLTGVLPALVEPIRRDADVIGQIRVGPREDGGFGHEHMQKLRHYGTLFCRLLDASRRADELRDMAYHDELTGLGNRRRLAQFLDEILARARQERFAVTVLMFDIDDFKRYNDQYGHAAGDAIIRETAQLFERCCRKHDVVCRHGGDEFVVVFWDAEAPRVPGSRHPHDVITILQRLMKALRSHAFSHLGPEAQGCLTVSGGLATFPWQAGNAEELLQRADEALLEAKACGKNSFWLVGSGEVCRAADVA